MDQEKNFEEDGQSKLITRSAARHLRRKRLNEARRARNQFLLEFINGVDEKINQETEAHFDSEKNKLTKSKARRLRKKEKAKLLETCNCDTSLVSTNLLQFEPNCCIKSEKNTFDTHINNVQHFEDLLAQSLLSLGNHNKAVGKIEETIECEFKYDKQDKDRSQTYLTQLVNVNSEDPSDSPLAVVYSALPKSKNKEQNHCTKNSPGIKRSYLESCNIKVDQLSDTFPISEKPPCRPKYFITPNAKKDHEVASKNISLNNKTLEERETENIVTSETCPLKYDHNINTLESLIDKQNPIEPISNKELILENKINLSRNFNHTSLEEKEDIDSSSIFQQLSEEALNIETTSENPIVQRQSFEESKESILSINPTSDSVTSTINVQPNKIMDSKMTGIVKTREEIKAEREARKAAKAASKGKGKVATGTSEKQNIPVKVDQISNDNIKVETSKVTKLELNNIPITENNSINTIEDFIIESMNIKSEGKSKAELRAERRAKQEAQRAAKQEQVIERTKIKSKCNTTQPKQVVTTTVEATIDDSMNNTVKKIVKRNTHEVNLFKHLYHERELALNNVPVLNSKIHPAIVKLGVQYANKIIVGSNARCVALLVAMKQLIEDFEQPSKTDFVRGLEANLKESVAYLNQCRPLAVSMQNALRHLKWQMTQLVSTSTDIDAKNKLMSSIDTYILEQIQLADESISITIQTKISNGNVILTYGYSSLIQKILMDAYDAGKQFRVIIVDGRPWLEGKEQLRRLTKHGIDCSYVLINALSFVMPEVSKVFLGAHAILANGAVMSRVGTAQVALMARSFNVPVLVACETHKSCERVQTDSIVYNELGNADELIRSTYRNTKKSLLQNWRTKKYLNLLNITYDVTPADLVTAVVTELAILPCTSVPVILRIKPSEI
ncbi:translation initiation factor eIF-2B subunit delta-like isoform X2 [Vespa mandarinia]|uniref:translation initiation factor eIF-2B subunit delta-like isoform X2 n=1 Tax=Vespa mandarinia TaxID=7446 RepID=UPI00161A7E60|nr:translation initiation factor eIF-2B subunit delta-like isoform X2 [Vespa mandarinia]XP_035728071.1 translation initiation factor eIF-2B subunit delta-like isoform X2 [Vespa mandarinia]XP_035728072.1 translation initiation factor eIF-2B subunit delta-like isoform X2 [Vespa mandarinia]